MAEEVTYKNISPAELAGQDLNKFTIVDLREPDELIVSGISGAINLPFSTFPKGIDDIPKDKPVCVLCREGSFSEDVAEILADRGYDVYNLEGGYKEYRKLKEKYSLPDETATVTETAASHEELFVNARSLRCPGPIVKVADTLRELPDGSVIKVEATEDAFYSDIKVWTERTGNKLLSLDFSDGVITARILKSVGTDGKTEPGSAEVSAGIGNTHIQTGDDKTFIVFSGDLDKTIAAFIIANGAASLGRKVTMFFTFWGLNILRRKEKVKTVKTFIEKMFGIMMPRGSKKLGLSRMNMFGAGSKMIRGIMKSKGISSLEELIDSARAHGVRIVACQMSMDVMGIKKEELIDGVELGGVATFIGAGETSDISLFI